MSLQVDAIYDNGVLRPLVPLSLPDQTRVKVTVEAQCSDVAMTTDPINEALAPVRKAFEASELSEDAAADLFEAEKHALRRERREQGR